MNREEYVVHRNNNSPDPLYEYYKENYKGEDLLDVHTFMKGMSMWPSATEAYRKVLQEYDIKFEIMSIQDLKTGHILKYL